MRFCYFGKSHIGKVRSKNEDTFLVEEVFGGDYLLAVVVDGIGGESGGDVAAYLAAKCIREHIVSVKELRDSAEVLQAAVIYANNTIHSYRLNPRMCYMGCVLTAMIVNLQTGQIDVCHVGDTRLYIFGNGVLQKLTSDHSMVGPLEESGQLSEEAARRHPMRNRITRSIGSEYLSFGTDYIQHFSHQLNVPCSLLLCSDGLYDMISSGEMRQILDEGKDVSEQVERLVEAALDAGGKDNVTAMVVSLQ